MRKLDESREILYVIRTMDVLMGAGVGKAITGIGLGGVHGHGQSSFLEGVKRNVGCEQRSYSSMLMGRGC